MRGKPPPKGTYFTPAPTKAVLHGTSIGVPFSPRPDSETLNNVRIPNDNNIGERNMAGLFQKRGYLTQGSLRIHLEC